MNVVFDFGGVLLRWRPVEFMPRLLPAHATDEAATRTLVAGFFQGFNGDWGEFDRGRIDADTLATRIAARTGVEVDDVRRVVDAIPHELVPLPDSLVLLERLAARGHRLFFLSNMPAPYADHLDREHAFLSAFEDGVYSSRVHLIKPEPAIFDAASSRFGIEPAQTLFIDDMAYNVNAARERGWQALHFADAAGCEAELLRLGLL